MTEALTYDVLDEPAGESWDEIKRTRVRRAAEALLAALDVDLDDPELGETPRRVAAMYEELLTPEPFVATTFANDAAYEGLVLARAVPFTSLCAHHMLPFRGVAHVGYLPGERLLGLSKLARVVRFHARGLQVQERLTQQVADWLQMTLAPRGVGVAIEAEHECMTIRGVQAAGTTTFTSAAYGALRDDPAARAEFLALAGRRA